MEDNNEVDTFRKRNKTIQVDVEHCLDDIKSIHDIKSIQGQMIAMSPLTRTIEPILLIVFGYDCDLKICEIGLHKACSIAMHDTFCDGIVEGFIQVRIHYINVREIKVFRGIEESNKNSVDYIIISLTSSIAIQGKEYKHVTIKIGDSGEGTAFKENNKPTLSEERIDFFLRSCETVTKALKKCFEYIGRLANVFTNTVPACDCLMDTSIEDKCPGSLYFSTRIIYFLCASGVGFLFICAYSDIKKVEFPDNEDAIILNTEIDDLQESKTFRNFGESNDRKYIYERFLEIIGDKNKINGNKMARIKMKTKKIDVHLSDCEINYCARNFNLVGADAQVSVDKFVEEKLGLQEGALSLSTKRKLVEKSINMDYNTEYDKVAGDLSYIENKFVQLIKTIGDKKASNKSLFEKLEQICDSDQKYLFQKFQYSIRQIIKTTEIPEDSDDSDNGGGGGGDGDDDDDNNSYVDVQHGDVQNADKDIADDESNFMLYKTNYEEFEDLDILRSEEKKPLSFKLIEVFVDICFKESPELYELHFWYKYNSVREAVTICLSLCDKNYLLFIEIDKNWTFIYISNISIAVCGAALGTEIDEILALSGKDVIDLNGICNFDTDDYMYHIRCALFLHGANSSLGNTSLSHTTDDLLMQLVNKLYSYYIEGNVTLLPKRIDEEKNDSANNIELKTKKQKISKGLIFGDEEVLDSFLDGEYDKIVLACTAVSKALLIKDCRSFYMRSIVKQLEYHYVCSQFCALLSDTKAVDVIKKDIDSVLQTLFDCIYVRMTCVFANTMLTKADAKKYLSKQCCDTDELKYNDTYPGGSSAKKINRKSLRNKILAQFKLWYITSKDHCGPTTATIQRNLWPVKTAELTFIAVEKLLEKYSSSLEGESVKEFLRSNNFRLPVNSDDYKDLTSSIFELQKQKQKKIIDYNYKSDKKKVENMLHLVVEDKLKVEDDKNIGLSQLFFTFFHRSDPKLMRFMLTFKQCVRILTIEQKIIGLSRYFFTFFRKDDPKLMKSMLNFKQILKNMFNINKKTINEVVLASEPWHHIIFFTKREQFYYKANNAANGHLMRLYLCDSNKALLMTMKSYDACLEPYCDANKLEVIGKNSLEFENLFDTFDINLKENIKSLLTVYTANIVSSCKRKVDEVEHDAKKQVLLKLGHSKQTVSNLKGRYRTSHASSKFYIVICWNIELSNPIFKFEVERLFFEIVIANDIERSSIKVDSRRGEFFHYFTHENSNAWTIMNILDKFESLTQDGFNYIRALNEFKDMIKDKKMDGTHLPDYILQMFRVVASPPVLKPQDIRDNSLYRQTKMYNIGTTIHDHVLSINFLRTNRIQILCICCEYVTDIFQLYNILCHQLDGKSTGIDILVIDKNPIIIAQIKNKRVDSVNGLLIDFLCWDNSLVSKYDIVISLNSSGSLLFALKFMQLLNQKSDRYYYRCSKIFMATFGVIENFNDTMKLFEENRIIKNFQIMYDEVNKHAVKVKKICLIKECIIKKKNKVAQVHLINYDYKQQYFRESDETPYVNQENCILKDIFKVAVIDTMSSRATEECNNLFDDDGNNKEIIVTGGEVLLYGKRSKCYSYASVVFIGDIASQYSVEYRIKWNDSLKTIPAADYNQSVNSNCINLINVAVATDERSLKYVKEYKKVASENTFIILKSICQTAMEFSLILLNACNIMASETICEVLNPLDILKNQNEKFIARLPNVPQIKKIMKAEFESHYAFLQTLKCDILPYVCTNDGFTSLNANKRQNLQAASLHIDINNATLKDNEDIIEPGDIGENDNTDFLNGFSTQDIEDALVDNKI